MFLTLRRSSRGPASLYAAGRRSCHTPAGSITWSSTDTTFGISGMAARLSPAIWRGAAARDCHDLGSARFYARVMALRILRVSAARWARLAATRRGDASVTPTINLVALEAEEDLGR